MRSVRRMRRLRLGRPRRRTSHKLPARPRPGFRRSPRQIRRLPLRAMGSRGSPFPRRSSRLPRAEGRTPRSRQHRSGPLLVAEGSAGHRLVWGRRGRADAAVGGRGYAFPPLGRVVPFALKVLDELNGGRVARAALLAPLDLSDSWLDRVLARRRAHGAGPAGDVLEPTVAEIPQKLVPLIQRKGMVGRRVAVVHDPAVDGEEVEPAVVVGVEPGRPEPGIRQAGHADPCLRAPVLEQSGAVIDVERAPCPVSSVTNRSSSPSLSKSPKSTLMSAFAVPSPPRATPASSARFRKVPSRWFIQSWFSCWSLATKMSIQPSPSASAVATPSAGPNSRAIPAAAVASRNVPSPRLR